MSEDESFFVPRNVTQSVRNVNDKPTHVQILFTPSGREEFLEKVSVLNALLLQYSQVNLPEVTWQDIGCEVSNSAVSLSVSLLVFLSRLFL